MAESVANGGDGAGLDDAGDGGILPYYKRELAYLRTEGAAFAERYPSVAARIAWHGTESPDPHTERLIEATAFLAARVHRDLDQAFPQLAAALLDNVCPSLVQPVPSMTVVQFELDAGQGKVTAGYAVPRHTGLHARTESGEACRFRTAWDTTLWPLAVTQARMTEDHALRLTLECAPGVDFSELELGTLRLHLHGDWMVTVPLYEALVTSVAGVRVAPPNAPQTWLPASAWREAGYGADENVLPQPPHAQPAYGLMQEYFAFARKFHFFDLDLPAGRLGNGRSCEVELCLRRGAPALGRVHAGMFRLGCVPAINLFAQTSEPIVLDHRHYEHRLVADQRREAMTEIHSIRSVVLSDPDSERALAVPPFAAASGDPAEGALFWHARREPTLRASLSGTDMYLSFVDARNVQQLPAAAVAYANVLCTNRRLAEQVPVGARLVLEDVSQYAQVRCLYEPTAQRNPPMGSETLWQLVTLLTRHHGTLASGATGRQAVQQMLRLFAGDGQRQQEQVRGIRSVRARGATAHVGSEAWRGYCRGTEVAVEFDPDAFVGGSPLLLGAVLAHFFALYTSVNSFVRLVVRRGDETWKQWPAMTGSQQLL
ncbi:type VI secretion system baseplate subunit TssF [Cupriavidus taiwanensis]|uniref:type VI secretion system baseplate subunit TssF n=1 Tax=Cupriavidus taiwanensis TaxID=164546 RepID=UPI001572559F|nr:type VI secretion system baseplate subunit TssF [Cupriavidus taiwanensis]NSX16286.1 type VI secretion system baseplate subunit TssF [Cupriavidus taiwanensis]